MKIKLLYLSILFCILAYAVIVVLSKVFLTTYFCIVKRYRNIGLL